MSETLCGEHVTLQPLKDIEYAIDLAYKENKFRYPREQMADMFIAFGQEFWEAYFDGGRWGVVGYFKFDGAYVMEALVDHSVSSMGLRGSIEGGKLMMEYLFARTDKINTCARVEDRAIQILCRKLGFREIDQQQGLIIYGKERQQCQ
jgi:hypothetical protein